MDMQSGRRRGDVAEGVEESAERLDVPGAAAGVVLDQALNPAGPKHRLLRGEVLEAEQRDVAADVVDVRCPDAVAAAGQHAQRVVGLVPGAV